MAMEIPTDAIKAVQISLRKEASMSSYDPDDTPLPNLPSAEETIAELDPSPPYLRCKHCKGRLLRGVQSLICVFCGREHCKDLPPEPINFRDTFGYRWLLQSLSLNGSEIVELPIGANELYRGQTARKNELSLSDLLNIDIKWSSMPEKTATVISNETLAQPKLVPALSGVNLHNFFSEGKKDVASNTSEQLFEASTQSATVENNTFQGHETLSLFENVQPSEGERGDSFSGWAADFQSSASENLPQASEILPQASEILPQAAENLPQATENIPQESKFVDPFVVSEVDLSAQLDTVFGVVAESTNEKSKQSPTGSASTTTDWFQDDLLGVSSSGLPGRPDQFQTPAEVKGGIAGNADDPFPVSVDWVQENQLQMTSNKASDNKTTVKDDDSFGVWNDFSSSNSAPNLTDSSVKQSFSQTTPVDQTSAIDLFGTASNSGDLDFGSFLQPDFSGGAFNRSNGSTMVDITQPEPSVLDRLADPSTNDEKKSEDVMEGGGVLGVRAGSQSEDVERIMSQMHDLSFMLESSLSVPPKQDALQPRSHD